MNNLRHSGVNLNAQWVIKQTFHQVFYFDLCLKSDVLCYSFLDLTPV